MTVTSVRGVGGVSSWVKTRYEGDFLVIFAVRHSARVLENPAIVHCAPFV